MPKKQKEELFTEQMGRNIFVFPPAREEDSTLRMNVWRAKKLKKSVYSGIPLKNLEATYTATFGRKRNIQFGT